MQVQLSEFTPVIRTELRMYYWSKRSYTSYNFVSFLPPQSNKFLLTNLKTLALKLHRSGAPDLIAIKIGGGAKPLPPDNEKKNLLISSNDYSFLDNIHILVNNVLSYCSVIKSAVECCSGIVYF